jgi:hypothetical protein
MTKKNKIVLISALIAYSTLANPAFAGLWPFSGRSMPPAPAAPAPKAEDVVKEKEVILSEEMRAAREKEMLSKMDTAVQEIAGFYGNPRFVRLMTNDTATADQFKSRLAATKKMDDLEKEVAAMKADRDSIAADIALRNDTLKNLNERILRSRATIDAISKMATDTQRAIEDSVKPAVVINAGKAAK